jgi:hypothetical protein
VPLPSSDTSMRSAGGGVPHHVRQRLLRMTFIALLVGAFSAAALRARFVARWVGWVGLAVAVSATPGTVGVALNSGILYGFWFGGLFGWVLWYPVVGVALALRARSARRAALRAGTGDAVAQPAAAQR